MGETADEFLKLIRGTKTNGRGYLEALTLLDLLVEGEQYEACDTLVNCMYKVYMEEDLDNFPLPPKELGDLAMEHHKLHWRTNWKPREGKAYYRDLAKIKASEVLKKLEKHLVKTF